MPWCTHFSSCVLAGRARILHKLTTLTYRDLVYKWGRVPFSLQIKGTGNFWAILPTRSKGQPRFLRSSWLTTPRIRRTAGTLVCSYSRTRIQLSSTMWLPVRTRLLSQHDRFLLLFATQLDLQGVSANRTLRGISSPLPSGRNSSSSRYFPLSPR